MEFLKKQRSEKTRMSYKILIQTMVFMTGCMPVMAAVTMQTGLSADSVSISDGASLTTGANTLDVGAGSAGLTISGSGTLNATNATVTVGGKFLHSATGTFTSTGSTFTFDASSGGPYVLDSGGDAFNTVIVNANGITYNVTTSNLTAAGLTVTDGTLDMNALDLAVTGNLLIDGGALDGSDTNCDMDINGNVTVTSGTLTAPAVADDTSFKVGGNWQVSGTGTFTHSSGRVFFDAGDSGNTIVTTSSNNDDFYDATFNNAGGAWTASDAMEVASSLSIAAGVFTAPSTTLTIGKDLTVAGTFTANGGTVTLNGVADVEQILDGNITFYNLSKTLSGTGTTSGITLDDADTFTVTNSLTLTGVTDNKLIFKSDDGTNTVDFDYTKAGTGTQSVSHVTATRIDSATGVDIMYNGSDTTVTACVGWVAFGGGDDFIWDGASSTAWNAGNNWNVGTIPSATSNVTIPNVSADPVLDQDRTVGALTIQTGGQLDLNENVLTVTSALANSGLLIASGAGTPFSAGTLTNNAGSEIRYTGVAADTTVNIVAGTYDDITFNNAGTNFLLQGNIIANDDLTLTAGILDPDSNGNTAGGTVYNVTVKGNANFTGTFTKRTSTVTLFNDGADEIKTFTTGSNAFNNLTINHTAGTTNTARVSGALDIDGDFNLSDGTLDLATNNVAVNVAGHVTLASGGTVTKAASAAWTFDGSTQNYTDSNGTKQNLGIVVVA